jgi:hypothetical protein
VKRAYFALVLALAGLTAATQTSCQVHEYCLNCATGDGGGSGGGDATDAPNDDAGDGGGSGCINTGVEVCDGKDNDCNNAVDDNIAEIGQPCMNQVGECNGGTYTSCTNGKLVCSKPATPEICDGKDNDCNGLTDEGDPGGGGKCGTDVGECIAGVNHCVGGMVQCQGAVGTVNGQPEICDAKDNDCDGMFDEGLTNLGSCGFCFGGSMNGASCTANAQCPGGTCGTNAGECNVGTLMCSGGAPQCMNAIAPTFEACDMKDNDCNGVVDNGYNLNTDPNNCGACGNICNLPNANNGCSNSPAPAHCTIASCKAGYHNNNGTTADGCEFGPCFITGVEVCDGTDNDCDGLIDEGLTPPAICSTAGECSGTTAMCMGSSGWKCNYGPTVSTDANGNIVPETLCDTKDNDCDTRVDEGQPNLNQACTDGNAGVCQGKGTFKCDPANLNGPAICNITMPGQMSGPEVCDNLDNNCNGQIDEGGNTGNLIGQTWIDIGGGRQMMKYEASKPDADAMNVGNVTTLACSKQGALPWTNVTYPQAVAACTSIGARLCSESEWHRTCSVVAPTAIYPVAVPAGAFTKLIEAEDYSSIAFATDTGVTPNVTHAWVPDTTPGFSGISAMQANPDSGSNINTAANALVRAPHLDYQFNFAAAGNYRVCVKTYSNTANENTLWVGISATPGTGALTSVTTAGNAAWLWSGPTGAIAVTAGVRSVSIYMQEDGLRIDQVYLTSGTTCPANTSNPAGGKWAYAVNPNTYQATTCNGHDFTAANDNILATGSLASCFANGAGTADVFDMSGNVKEWTVAQKPGQNPIRGGASNNTGDGISCPLDFTLGDDSFFFPNVGFRCCR